jgi:hypothetical protein
MTRQMIVVTQKRIVCEKASKAKFGMRLFCYSTHASELPSTGMVHARGFPACFIVFALNSFRMQTSFSFRSEYKKWPCGAAFNISEMSATQPQHICVRYAVGRLIAHIRTSSVLHMGCIALTIDVNASTGEEAESYVLEIPVLPDICSDH